MNISQRRTYFQHITILALGLSGVTFFTDKVSNKVYFILGFSLLLLVVLLILAWLRETLDTESKGLEALQDRYNIASDEKEALIEEYIGKQYRPDILREYISKVQLLPSAKIINDDVQKQAELRKGRSQQTLDYFGESIIFLFSSGILFLFLSVIHYTFNFLLLISLAILIFGISFQDFVIKKNGLISKWVSYLHKKIL
ncbi:MAG TPA: hypothetical protein VG982_00450 [Candidatus Paceibacterota bacterium]|nr:hypothetical protein [Candidatus Paceibacterota bacterium]